MREEIRKWLRLINEFPEDYIVEKIYEIAKRGERTYGDMVKENSL